MLLRLVVKNLFSFKDFTEFNTTPGRFSRLPQHVYKAAGADVLKLNAIYGANGAGKSNVVRVIELLQEYLKSGSLPLEFIISTFKFDPESRKTDVYIGIEFVKDEIPYYYGLTLNNGLIIEEELLISGLQFAEDTLLFRRTDSNDPDIKKLEVVFSDDILVDKEASLFPAFLQNELLERNKPVLYYMKNRQSSVFDRYRKAIEWFMNDLVLIYPDAVPPRLALQLENDHQFFHFVQDVIQTFNTGVAAISVETIPIETFFGEDNKDRAERITAELRADPDKVRLFLNPDDDEVVVFVMREGKAVAKRLYFQHTEDNGQAKFTIAEESDGTRRLIEYLPAWFKLINSSRVYIIDEIERSIHPLMIKELIRKFSHDSNTKGQLIFSTHESNLLDQDIFRPDEIWFAEKNKEGATELVTLSEFREHHTIDIRKGYLAGRYGGIPFLGNLKDLNWDKYAEADKI